MATQSVETKRTYCRVCTSICGLAIDVDVENDQIISVKGDFQHPLTKGYTCPKGRAMGQVRHMPNPITEPLMRKNGKLVPVSWDEALDDVAAKLRKTIDAYGPHSIGIYFGSGLGIDSSGYSMMEAFYNALGTPPKFTPLTNDGTNKTMLAGAMGGSFVLNPKTDYDNVMLMLYVGTNPMVSHSHNTGMFNPATWIKAITKRGGEVWTIDPLLTETAKLSTGHFAPYPGKDYAVLAWIVRELIDHGPMTPKQPIQGLAEVRAVLEGYDLDKAALIAGVEPHHMQALLAAIRKYGKLSIETGTGVSMSSGCNLTQWFAWMILVLTGSMNTKGGCWFHPGFLNPYEKMPEIPVADYPFSASPTTRPDVKGIVGDWPCAVLPKEIEAGNVRALFNFGGSMIRSFPDTNALTAAMKTLELNVNTEIAHNETTELSTHILPPKYGLERHEFTRWDFLNWNVSLQYSPPLVKPMGQRRSAWWILSQFMKRAGLPVPSYVPESDLVEGTDEFMLSTLMTNARCTFKELQEKRFVEFPHEFPAEWVEKHFQRIGGWRFAFPEIMEQWRTMRADDEANLGKSRPLVYSSRRQRKKFNAQLDFMGVIADVILHPDTAAERGIVDGQKVRVFNKAGEINLTAKIDPTIRRGVASIPHGHRDANVNFLTSTEDMDRLGGMAHYSGVPIEIEPAA